MRPFNSIAVLALLLLQGVVGQNGRLERRVTRRVRCSNDERAENDDTVYVSYTGSLVSNGEVFDSTEGKAPISFELGTGRVIKGWDQGLLGTCPGESLELIIPPSLAYGSRGAGDVIPPNASLRFTLTLERLEKAAEPGLQISTISGGDCEKSKRIREKDRIEVHYKAFLASDTTETFDDSYERNQPLSLTVGRAGIPAWDEGVKGACPGEKRRVFAPSKLAYGSKGVANVVPPNADIVLEIEVLQMEDRVVSFLHRISSGNFGNGK